MAKFDWDAYNKGIDVGRDHSVPSKKTQEKLDEFENRCIRNTTKFGEMLENMKKELERISNKTGDLYDEIAKLSEKIDEALKTKVDKSDYKEELATIKTALKSKADNHGVEKIKGDIGWVVKLILGTLILAVITLVLKN